MKSVVAGRITAQCTCCQSPAELIHHVALGGERMLCPNTRQTYLDRGDGVFVRDDVPDVLSETPARTNDKTRIQLERATFA